MLAALGGQGGADLLAEVMGGGRQAPKLQSNETSFRSIGAGKVSTTQGETQTSPRSFNTRSPFNQPEVAPEAAADDDEDGEDTPAPSAQPKGSPDEGEDDLKPPKWFDLLNADNQQIKQQLVESQRQTQEMFSRFQQQPREAAPQEEPKFELDPELEPFKQYIDHRLAKSEQSSAQTLAQLHGQQAYEKATTAYNRLKGELPDFDKHIVQDKFVQLIQKAATANPYWANQQNWESELRNGYRASAYDAVAKENAELKKQLSTTEAKAKAKKAEQKEKLHLVPGVSGGQRAGSGETLESLLFGAHPRDRKRDFRSFANQMKAGRKRLG